MRKAGIAVITFLIGVGIELGEYKNPTLSFACFLVAGGVGLWAGVTSESIRNWRKPISLGHLSLDPLLSALLFRSYVHEANYRSGTNLEGIEWQDEFVDVRLDIQNTVGIPIQNLDMQLQLDTSIFGMGQLSRFQDVEWSAETFGMIPPSLAGEDKSGNPISVPIVPLSGMQIGAKVYRLRCGRITPGSIIQLVIASVAVNPMTPGNMPERMFAPKRNPEWIAVRGSYETGAMDGQNRYSIEFQRQLGHFQLERHGLRGNQFLERVAEEVRVATVIEPPLEFVQIGI